MNCQENGSYPATTKVTAQQLWNFKRKAAKYILSEVEPKRLYKVSSLVLVMYSFKI